MGRTGAGRRALPVRVRPDAPELAGLRARAPELFPAGRRLRGLGRAADLGGGCSKVNRPAVHTIYPPVAEGWFAGLYALGGRYGVRAAQRAGRCWRWRPPCAAA
ncbi:hypothetical protein GCM10020229_43210 [Kitasatospora albolonga]|uniref:hypothetical protein n=1 Tax=Kitasatospora albolonga TaxID=68173 RepID=UPI0031EE3E57